MSEERVQISEKYARARLDQIVAEADAEMAAELKARGVAEVRKFEQIPFVAVPPVEEVAVQPVASVVPSVIPADAGIQSASTISKKLFADRYLGEIVVCSIVKSVAVSGWLAYKYTDGVSMEVRGPAVFAIAMLGIFPGLGLSFCLFWASDAIERLGGLKLLTVPVNAISNTALGAWTVVRGTAVGIGVAAKWTGIGLYYAITNQLMLSASLEYCERLYGKKIDMDFWRSDAGGWAFLGALAPHLLGVIASIVAVAETNGTPLTDKLIFGWWAFYALNIFYAIGRETREARKS